MREAWNHYRLGTALLYAVLGLVAWLLFHIPD